MLAAAARALAIAVHGDQRYGEEPYVVHLQAVVDHVIRAGGGEQAIAAAWLHDVLEDTSVEEGELRQRFGDEIAAAVALVSDPPGPDRRTRKEALHRRLAAVTVDDPAGRMALLVKTADRLANVEASVADNPRLLALYRREHPDFRAAVHRPGLGAPLWEELERLLASVG